ncbi:MAG: XisI protein, partial [Acidobacteria bacterium]|nr:XisI protein [Acidobacteriota bacterium]
MDKLETMRSEIEKVLSKYTEPPFTEEGIETEVVFDRQHDRYLLVEVGWEKGLRVHQTVAHLDIINGKIWI